MKVAIAQIDMRLGDIEAICARIESQAVLAHEQGVRLLMTPAPLFAGMLPGTLADAENYVHDILLNLGDLSKRLAAIDVIALVPAYVSYDGTPVLEVFMLKQQRVIPVRTLTAFRREQADEDLWLPPLFDIDGTRCAVTFDFERDMELLPAGCDLVIYFQMHPFSTLHEEFTAVASVADGHYRPEVVRRSMWLAYVAPVGGFDEVAYTGGSFVMDDCGRVVAAAPCFEESLLVQDVQRGVTVPCVEDHELPQYQRETWEWEALRLGLADIATAGGASRAALVLDGDLPSSLAAVLCVDAFGPRNVVGLFLARQQVVTPAQEVAERDRAERVRALAASLHIKLVERDEPDAASLLDRDEPAAEAPRAGMANLWARAGIERLYLEDVARREHALPVSSLTKTDYALAPAGVASGIAGAIAPFGDVYLSALESLASARGRASNALPRELVNLASVERSLASIFARVVSLGIERPEYEERAACLLRGLEPSQVDGVLEAHVDRGLSLDDIPLAASKPEAVALLLMLVRRGEAARRNLPLTITVSGGSFLERAWPISLAWSDIGRHGASPQTLAGLVQSEATRAEALGAEMGARMRGEIMGFIGNILGIAPDQLEALSTEEGRQRLGKNLPQIEQQVQRSLQELFESGEEGGGPNMPYPGSGHGRRGFSFFSQN